MAKSEQFSVMMVRFRVFVRMVDVLDMVTRKNSILTDTMIDSVFFVRLLPCGWMSLNR